MAAGREQLQPRRRPRQRRAEDTRERILDAAVHVFAVYGYDRGTTNRIAEGADISVGSVYQYFPNKDAILMELAARHLDLGIAAVRDRRPARPPASLQEAIGEIVATAVDNHRQDPAFLRVLLERAPRSSDLMRRVAELQDAATTAMRALLDGHPEVRVADRDAAARLAVVTIEAVVHQALAAPAVLDPAGLARELTVMLTRYLTH
ncbi:TetR/AcrR family transcriptional regulator [Mycobacterium sp. WMMD1722]|uniref:TetR/AcrR family transcriptional regulator n=1 Tax=Mycobacterium sp. WMMD1722 TaxID=3404117 RepID=UPI003BF578A3